MFSCPSCGSIDDICTLYDDDLDVETSYCSVCGWKDDMDNIGGIENEQECIIS